MSELIAFGIVTLGLIAFVGIVKSSTSYRDQYRRKFLKLQDESILVIKDFIIAIDDGEPEKLSSAYSGAFEFLDQYE
jgi:hypothetical protein